MGNADSILQSFSFVCSDSGFLLMENVFFGLFLLLMLVWFHIFVESGYGSDIRIFKKSKPTFQLSDHSSDGCVNLKPISNRYWYWQSAVSIMIAYRLKHSRQVRIQWLWMWHLDFFSTWSGRYFCVLFLFLPYVIYLALPIAPVLLLTFTGSWLASSQNWPYHYSIKSWPRFWSASTRWGCKNTKSVYEI